MAQEQQAADELRPENNFLSGGGELGAMMRAKDWSATALGSPETWPHSLQHRRAHPAHLALCDVDGLGPRSHLLL